MAAALAVQPGPWINHEPYVAAGLHEPLGRAEPAKMQCSIGNTPD